MTQAPREMGLATLLEERAREARLLGSNEVIIPLEAVDPLQASLFLIKDFKKSTSDKYNASHASCLDRAWSLLIRYEDF